MSWAAGALLAIPALVPSAWSLDHGGSQSVLGAATVAGGFFCLLTGFFKTRWVFPVYIVAIAAADTVAGAAHGRHLGVMVRGLTARRGHHHFERRRSLTSMLFMHATAAGCLGAAIIAAFTYHMLRRSDHHTSLWVVSIFSGLLWFAGMAHAFTTVQTGTAPSRRRDHGKLAHVLEIFHYPHAVGSLVGIFLSSSSSMCIFIGGILYVFGQLCMKPVSLLSLWMIYFIFPVVSLPAVHVLQLVLRADAVRMQLLGFFMSAVTAGAGFYYRGSNWHRAHVLLAALLQSTASGTLHAFGRVLTLDCSPAGGEGAFSTWASWVRTAGSCAGFALASVYPGDVGKTFGMSFCAVVLGSCVLVFGNVSHERGVEAAGHVEEEAPDQESFHGLEEKGRQGRRHVSEPSHEKLEDNDGIQQV
ncbi:hypothetical protein Taro_044141 [Colocasia esculenta]|uniref:Uncharacterized protein n=1 Tax=Colocasia esculenta TaxID=4460 RepID=A0A843WTT4_COLES|nr:hypothetical protein [Colocasia esculenta]